MSAHKLIAVTIASALALAACSGGESDTTSTSGSTSGGAQTCPFDYAGYDGTAAVSFDADVFPVVRRSCGFSPCHGKPVGSAAGLYLGPSNMDMMTVVDMALKQQIIDSLTGVPANTAMTMNRVTVSDPEHSFLMLKVDGCQSAANLTCMLQPGGTSMDPCGDAMPPGQPLSADERDLFRRWISQGAQNN